MANGTRTAPVVDGTPNFKHVAFTFIDASGDQRTISGDFEVATTDTEIDALGDALEDASQASLWKISVTAIYQGDDDSGNAVTGSRDSVYDNVAVRLKNATTNAGTSWFIPAPAPEIMLGDLDQIDPASTELAAVFTAILAMAPGFQVKSARYTERREINQAVKI